MLITTLRAAVQARSNPSLPAEWRSTRDRWVDLFDPTGHHGDPDRQQIRELVDFLAETAPSRTSRQSSAEWFSTIEITTERLISSLAGAS